MRRFKLYLTIIISILTPFNAESKGQPESIASLYKTLDRSIKDQPEYVAEKERRIKEIKQSLSLKDITPMQRYHINEQLYDEYSAFRYDSAFKYINMNIEAYKDSGEYDLLYRSMLRLVHILSVSGMFDKARVILEETDTDKLSDENLIEYYKQLSEYNLFMSEHTGSTCYFKEYNDKAQEYRSKILAIAPKGSYTYLFNHATHACEQGDIDEGIRTLERLLPKTKEGERKYSIITNTLAYFYRNKNQRDKQEYYLIRSAISDIRGAIREENSLRELANLLFENGQTDRALRYINTSIQDATFYGTKLRNLQAAPMVPEIITAYGHERDRKQLATTILLIIISAIALILIVSRFFRSRIIRRLEKANEKINQMNGQLNDTLNRMNTTNIMIKESNKIKDEYLTRFMELCNRIIERFDEQHKKENRLARDHKLPELYEELKSNKHINETTQLFYQNFDTAFLNIYPDFPQAVNNLLEPDSRIEPKASRLTTELRILALIRLGITDNQKIAGILRSSITTVYTYRSKLKARAVSKDSFEEDIKRIGAYY